MTTKFRHLRKYIFLAENVSSENFYIAVKKTTFERILAQTNLKILLTIKFLEKNNTVHCKKRLSFFLSPAGMSLTRHSMAGIIKSVLNNFFRRKLTAQNIVRNNFSRQSFF